MTDLELVRKCAERMGYGQYAWQTSGIVTGCDIPISLPTGRIHYDPLHDDAQAMALVKKFHIHIIGSTVKGESMWSASSRAADCFSKNLNRAICECVANLPEDVK